MDEDMRERLFLERLGRGRGMGLYVRGRIHQPTMLCTPCTLPSDSCSAQYLIRRLEVCARARVCVIICPVCVC